MAIKECQLGRISLCGADRRQNIHGNSSTLPKQGRTFRYCNVLLIDMAAKMCADVIKYYVAYICMFLHLLIKITIQLKFPIFRYCMISPQNEHCFRLGRNIVSNCFSYVLTCTGTLLNRIITAQWEGMGDVGSARYEPTLLPPCPTIKILSYSNCQRSTHSISK